MTITNGYTTLAELKGRLGIATADTADDTRLEGMVEAISRAIDELCGRRFYTTSSDETRYFTAEFVEVLSPGDLVSLTTLQTDEDGDRVYERTWAATDYDLEPFNAALDGEPYTEIHTSPNGSYAFPTTRKGVKLVAKFGWSTTPKAVAEGCLLLCEKLFRRKDAIFGVVAGGELGELKQMMRDDPEINLLLYPLRKMDILGV